MEKFTCQQPHNHLCGQSLSIYLNKCSIEWKREKKIKRRFVNFDENPSTCLTARKFIVLVKFVRQSRENENDEENEKSPVTNLFSRRLQFAQ